MVSELGAAANKTPARTNPQRTLRVSSPGQPTTVEDSVTAQMSGGDGLGYVRVGLVNEAVGMRRGWDVICPCKPLLQYMDCHRSSGRTLGTWHGSSSNGFRGVVLLPTPLH